ncbi:MAG: hypothetical protein FJW39_26230 [Acidobacteria bacterium]|nr:hypothetical protein [Acidobacteriota bacterium]
MHLMGTLPIHEDAIIEPVRSEVFVPSKIAGSLIKVNAPNGSLLDQVEALWGRAHPQARGP